MLLIWRMKQIGCHVEKRVNQPPGIIPKTSIYQTKQNIPSTSYSFSLPFVSLKDIGCVTNHRRFIDFFKLTTNLPLSSIYSHYVFFSEFTDNWLLSSNVLLGVYFLFNLFFLKWTIVNQICDFWLKRKKTKTKNICINFQTAVKKDKKKITSFQIFFFFCEPLTKRKKHFNKMSLQ